METSLDLYPYRVCLGAEEDEFGACHYLEVVDVDGYRCKLKFNDSNDCKSIDKLVRGLLDISSKLCEKAEWEEANCERCPED